MRIPYRMTYPNDYYSNRVAAENWYTGKLRFDVPHKPQQPVRTATLLVGMALLVGAYMVMKR